LHEKHRLVTSVMFSSERDSAAPASFDIVARDVSGSRRDYESFLQKVE